MFILDLSSSTVIECIDKMCEIKSWSHPNIRKNYKMLINKIKNIESLFECTITPAMINSVFWNYFIPFLTKQGLKYSTINQIKTNLITVLSWASKYGLGLTKNIFQIIILYHLKQEKNDSSKKK